MLAGDGPMNCEGLTVQFAWLQPKVLRWLACTHRQALFVWSRLSTELGGARDGKGQTQWRCHPSWSHNRHRMNRLEL